jgi:hypothetical protein
MKEIDLTNFKLFSQIEGKSIHNFDFFLKFVISFRAALMITFPVAESLAMPLCGMLATKHRSAELFYPNFSHDHMLCS